MKYLKSIFLAATLALGLGATANAALISQDILVTFADGTGAGFGFSDGDTAIAGSVTVEVDTNDSGVVFGDEYVAFNWLGVTPDPLDMYFFEFEADADNVYDGILSLGMDFDIFTGDYFTEVNYFVGGIDFFDNYTTTFRANGDLFISGSISLGAASVVSEPAVLAFLLIGLGALSLRRKA